MTEYTTETLQHGNCTIILHRPVLSNAEQAKREQAVKAAMETMLRGYITRKETKQ